MTSTPSDLTSLSDEELIQTRADALRAWNNYAFEVYKPRFYREKIGRKLDFINPWKSLEELHNVDGERKARMQRYYELHFECSRRGLPWPRYEIFLEWKEISTPYGIRYVRNSPEEISRVADSFYNGPQRA